MNDKKYFVIVRNDGLRLSYHPFILIDRVIALCTLRNYIKEKEMLTTESELALGTATVIENSNAITYSIKELDKNEVEKLVSSKMFEVHSEVMTPKYSKYVNPKEGI